MPANNAGAALRGRPTEGHPQEVALQNRLLRLVSAVQPTHEITGIISFDTRRR